MVKDESQGKAPLGCVPLFNQSATFSESRSNRLAFVCVCVCFGLRSMEILHLVGLSPAAVTVAHSNPQVWRSLLRSRHPKSLPPSPALIPNSLPANAVVRSVHSTRAVDDTHFSGRTLSH